MIWLWYLAWWTDLVGLSPTARPEARLLKMEDQRRAIEPSSTYR